MKRIKIWFDNLSLHLKIMLLILFAGFLPVGCILVISLKEIQKQHIEQQMYALNQSYEQVYNTLNDKMANIHNISTLIAVSDSSGMQNVLSEDSQEIARLLNQFSEINSYSYEMEMAFDACNIFFFINKDYPIINEYSGRFRSVSSVETTDWYQQLQENEGSPTWVLLQQNDLLWNNSGLAIVRALWSEKNYNEMVGVLTVVLEQEVIENALISTNENQMLYIESANGEILASNVEKSEVSRFLGIKDVNKTFEVIEIEKDPYLLKRQEIGNTGIFLISVLPRESLLKESYATITRMNFGYLLICFFVLIGIIPLTGTVRKRLRALQEQMNKSEEGKISKIEMQRECTDEIGQLVKQYNAMVDRVDVLLKEQYMLGEEKKGAELKALQSQINPHFLYNTLDMINWMAQKNETDNIREVVQAMSKFYRLTLSRGLDIISIEDEIKMCHAYMEIQKRRYKGRINYSVDVESEILEYSIPKITLQPFLENAIIHGINEKEEARGKITISGWAEDERIILCVTDDGVGMKEKQKTEGSGSNYGMLNIQKRLELFYQEKIDISIESSMGIGTCVSINIPMKK